jgi:hypothetical protein
VWALTESEEPCSGLLAGSRKMKFVSRRQGAESLFQEDTDRLD